MDGIEYKSISVQELKSSTDTNGRFYISGYASVFGNEDSFHDVVDPGAFAKSLDRNRHRILFCKEHDVTDVIGKILPESLVEDHIGLSFKCRLGRSAKAKDAIMQIEDGELGEFSIGYYPVKYHYKGGVRHLTEIDLLEISLVSCAANPSAVITASERKSLLSPGVIEGYTDDELIEVRNKVKSEIFKRVLTKIK